MPRRNAREQSLHIHAREDRVFGIAVRDALDQFQADNRSPASSPVVIDQLVACDGKEPGRERSLAIVGDPALMQRQKRILDQIVRILRVRRSRRLK